jgi:hypothetical protein
MPIDLHRTPTESTARRWSARADATAREHDERRRQEAEERARTQQRLADCEAELRYSQEQLRAAAAENHGLQDIASHINKLTRTPALLLAADPVADGAAAAATARRASPGGARAGEWRAAAARAEEGERPRAAIYEHTPTSFRGSPYSKS